LRTYHLQPVYETLLDESPVFGVVWDSDRQTYSAAAVEDFDSQRFSAETVGVQIRSNQKNTYTEALPEPQ
jgi:hypothetical protein